MDVKKQILDGLLRVIEDISDSAFQYRVWVQGKGPEWSSYDEIVCNFFDDFNAEEILMHFKEYGITLEQYLVFKKFYKIFRKYTDIMSPYYDIEVVEDPKWKVVQAEAEKVLQVFHYEKRFSKEPPESTKNVFPNKTLFIRSRVEISFRSFLRRGKKAVLRFFYRLWWFLDPRKDKWM